MSTLRRSLADKVFAELEQDILKGRLKAGSRLDEALIAERFAVSRTPAREALRLLDHAGLVRRSPRQGAVVRVPSAREYVAMAEILVELEALATRLATRRMSSAEREALSGAFAEGEAAVRADSRTAYAEANAHFHAVLYAGSRNEILAEQIRAMRRRMGSLRSNTFDHPGRIAVSCAEHARVLQAVLAGDEDAAHQAMREHITVGGTVYADLIASLGEPGGGAAR